VSRSTTIGVIIAGTVADVDGLSAQFGPSAFLEIHRTYSHSLIGVLLIGVIVGSTCIFLDRKLKQANSPPIILLATLGAAAFHLLMDLCQSEGVALFWPFSEHRFAADWVAHLDLWILTIFLAGVLLPRLFGLIGDEIGARSKGPRGRVGAGLALLAVTLYVCARVILHASAIGTLQVRTYHGESPRRIAAFPGSVSPFRWRGVIETERALHEVNADVGLAPTFDPESGVTFYKPEPSPPLDAARSTDAVRRFLNVARFPKATVEKTETGYRIELRDLPQWQDARAGWRVDATVETDPAAKVLKQEIIWDQVSREVWWSRTSHRSPSLGS
jgi:inner membrane protein